MGRFKELDIQRQEEAAMSLTDAHDLDRPALAADPAALTPADLRADAMRSVAAALRALDLAADRLCVLVSTATQQEADAIEGYARNIDEAREAIRAAKRWGMRV